ncbi:hypothetical protein MY3296_006759 [Beauveria thailandica]
MSLLSSQAEKETLGQAIKTFLEEAGPAEVGALLCRLRPYRIVTQSLYTAVDGAQKTTLVLDEPAFDSTGTNPPSPELTRCDDGLYYNCTSENPMTCQTWDDFLEQTQSSISASDWADMNDADLSLSCEPCDGIFGTTDVGQLSAFTVQPFSSNRFEPSASRNDFETPSGARNDIQIIDNTASINALNTKKASVLHLQLIRHDYLAYLRENLEHWVKEGLWCEDMLTTTPELAEPNTETLRHTYYRVCETERRTEDNCVRNRAAMVALHEQYEKTVKGNSSGAATTGRQQERSALTPFTTRGRGHASLIVDRLLERIHGAEWVAADKRRKTELRVRFHDRKRYGKRWAALAAHAGPGILFLSAPELASMVKSTKCPNRFLESIGKTIMCSDSAATDVLRAFNPVAERLIEGGRSYLGGGGGEECQELLQLRRIVLQGAAIEGGN